MSKELPRDKSDELDDYVPFRSKYVRCVLATLVSKDGVPLEVWKRVARDPGPHPPANLEIDIGENAGTSVRQSVIRALGQGSIEGGFGLFCDGLVRLNFATLSLDEPSPILTGLLWPHFGGREAYEDLLANPDAARNYSTVYDNV